MSDHDLLILSPEALFRYRIISTVEALVLSGRPLSGVVRQVAADIHPTVYGHPRRVSERTVYRWLAAFRKHGVVGFEPSRRDPLADSHVLSKKLLDFLKSEREASKDASIPELILRARKCGILTHTEKVDRTTVWRTFKRLGIETRRRSPPNGGDTRRFAYKRRMQMLLADFVHFRAGESRARRAALYLLDDATRFGLWVSVSTSENHEVFLRALNDVLRRFGLVSAIYADHGPAFSADDCARACANLNIPLILGTRRYPQGRGKIERFNRSVKRRLLRSLDKAVEVDPDCGSLDLRLRHDLYESYNHLPHEGLDNATPQHRWDACERDLRPVESEAQLTNAFTLTEKRLVSNDHIISYEGTRYEVPRGHAKERITLFRRILEGGALYVLHEGQLVRLQPVDTYHNAISPRGQSRHESEESGTPSKTASTYAFERAYGPITNEDGGFSDPTPDDEKEDA